MKTKRPSRTKKSRPQRPSNFLVRHAHFLLAMTLFLVNLSMWLIPAHYADAAAQGYLWYYEEQQFLSIVNNHRSSIGVGSLAASDCLTQAARAWAQQMANDNTLYHSPNGYDDSFCGASVSSAENALYSSDFSNLTAQGAFTIWHGSAGHRSNMEDSNFTHTGLGFYWDETHAKLWAVEKFYNCGFGCPGGVTDSPSYPSSNNASCRELEVPDSVQTGQGFSATAIWTNTGTSTWFTSYSALADNGYWGSAQTNLNADSFGPGGHSNPGMVAGYSQNFTAPGAAGSYEFSWHVRSDGGSVFGSACSKTITVTAPASSGDDNSPGSATKPTGSGSGGAATPATDPDNGSAPPVASATPALDPEVSTPTESTTNEVEKPKASTTIDCLARIPLSMVF